jgi:hypothetical protein
MDSNATGTAQPVNLDAAIDAVAREMTDAEPSGALRARVLDEIGRGRQRPGFAVPRWAWAGAAAALTLAVASSMWLVTRPADRAQEPVRVASSRPAPKTVSPAAQPAADAGTTTPAVVTTALASQVAAPRTATAPAETRDEDSHHLPALAEIEPLSFAAVGPPGLQMADVEVPSLNAMPSIHIPSLDPGPTDTTTADPKKEN